MGHLGGWTDELCVVGAKPATLSGFRGRAERAGRHVVRRELSKRVRWSGRRQGCPLDEGRHPSFQQRQLRRHWLVAVVGASFHSSASAGCRRLQEKPQLTSYTIHRFGGTAKAIVPSDDMQTSESTITAIQNNLNYLLGGIQ